MNPVHSAAFGAMVISMSFAFGCRDEAPANNPAAPPPIVASAPAAPRIDAGLSSSGSVWGSTDDGPLAAASTSAALQPSSLPSSLAVASVTAPGATFSDAQILQLIHYANTDELAQAKLAIETTKDARVKELAQAVSTDHGDAETKGAAVAKKQSIVLADSPSATALKADDDRSLASLRTLTGGDFDKAYADAQVKAHQGLLEMLDATLLAAAKDTEVQAYLWAIRPKVAAHLKQARRLQGDLGKRAG